MCEQEKERRERKSKRVFERERESALYISGRERACVLPGEKVCVCKRERKIACVLVGERSCLKAGERESVCVCVSGESV